MERSFSWHNFNRMSHALESLGYVVIVLGPLLGIAFLIFGSVMFKLTGAAMIVASILISMYHLSFALLMNSIRDIAKKLDLGENEGAENSTESSEIQTP